MKRKDEFPKFERAMTELLKVSHAEIKEKLDAEKKQRSKRKNRAKNHEGQSH